MGYQDRDYFRDERRPFLELIRSSRTCWVIIVVAAIVYLLMSFTADSSQPVEEYLELNVQAMEQPWQWYRLITAGLVDDQPWHLAFVLLLIWLIGHELEIQAGSVEFICFALLCLVISNLGLLVAGWNLPHARHLPAVGLAGICAGLWTWATWLSPMQTVNLAFVHVPRWILCLLLFLLEIFFFMKYQPLSIRLAVLLPPVLFAILYAHFNWKLTGWYTATQRSRAWYRNASLNTDKKYVPGKLKAVTTDMQPVSARHPKGRKLDEQLEAKLDAVLEKVSQSGMQSLTEEEKKILSQASEVMKKHKN